MLKITDFSKTYKGGKKAVSHLNLEILPGDIYGFIGHNGAGKTTTIKAAVGILDFEEGEILIDGHSIEKEPLLCKSMLAYIPDNPDLYEHLTGIQLFEFYCGYFPSGFRGENGADPGIRGTVRNYGQSGRFDFFLFPWHEAEACHYICPDS